MLQTPKGYTFAALEAGFKYSGRNDLAVIISDVPAVAAAVFTKNKFQAAPVTVGKEILSESQQVRGAIINAGLANACTGAEGIADCKESLILAAKYLGINDRDLLPASTGVIGPRFNMEKWREAASKLKKAITDSDPVKAAKAIMTTDKFPKLAWGEIEFDGKPVRMLGMCKGAGMISPDMATMLGFVTCDAEVDPDWWQEALRRCIDRSFNCITVDGDTSTNDTVMAFANGAAEIKADSDERKAALEALLLDICQQLSYMIVQDAEGGTKVMHINVTGAASDKDAELIARAVGNSHWSKQLSSAKTPTGAALLLLQAAAVLNLIPRH